jgi:hypothetical protein
MQEQITIVGFTNQQTNLPQYLEGLRSSRMGGTNLGPTVVPVDTTKPGRSTREECCGCGKRVGRCRPLGVTKCNGILHDD